MQRSNQAVMDRAAGRARPGDHGSRGAVLSLRTTGWRPLRAMIHAEAQR